MAQIPITYSGEEDRVKIAEFLKARGYRDVQGLAEREPEAWHVPCICVDPKGRVFFTVSATCAAGFSMSRVPFHKSDELEELFPEGQPAKHAGDRGPRAIYIGDER